MAVFWFGLLGFNASATARVNTGGEMMMKSVFWWRKPEYLEETTDIRQVTDKTAATDCGDGFKGQVFANDGFKIRGWDETGMHVGSQKHNSVDIKTQL